MATKSTENSELPIGWTQIRRHQKYPTSFSNTSSLYCCDYPTCRNGTNTCSPRRFTSDSNVLEGDGIFCLCEIDPSWFQGYFVVDKKPYRLLAQKSIIDEDLRCCMGGEDYRQIQLQVFPPSGRFENYENDVSFSNIQWTGGDMMNLRGEKLSFETKRFFSGKRAIPIMRKYFMAMVKKLLDNEEEDNGDSILKIIPDVSVVVGKMKLVLPPRI